MRAVYGPGDKENLLDRRSRKDQMKVTFEAVLPQDAAMPIKPTRDFNAATGKRRVRIWLDAFLGPGETETLLLMGEKILTVEVDSDSGS